MSKSKIEWTEKTWNPIVSGCSIISEGCSNCYAMKMAHRLEAMGQEKYKGLTKKTASGNIVWNGKINIDMDDKALYEPLKTKKPTMYFVNSMTDLFHEKVPFEVIDKIMAVIALSPHHTFQILTKRADRMKEYFTTPYLYKKIRGEAVGITNDFTLSNIDLPLPNLWLGVSVENQEQADKRIPYLLETPAKVRFLSMEPLMGEINITCILDNQRSTETTLFPLRGDGYSKSFHIRARNGDFIDFETGKIDWVIVGGESGAKARPMHPDWVRSIQQQCQEAGVPLFFKQWGEYVTPSQMPMSTYRLIEDFGDGIGISDNSLKVGKHKAGRLLDGKEYNEMPTI